MANPNNAVGTNGAFGGRTSVNAFNDVLSAFSGRGIVSGWMCSPSSGLTVALGGDGVNRDVAIALDASGNKTTINNISQSPVLVNVNAAPASNARVDAIVAYIEDSPNGDGTTDNPDVVNLLVVSGTVASSPIAPDDGVIRTAITADGASGSTAYYVVLATVRIPSGTTDVDTTMITQGVGVILRTALPAGSIGTQQIADNSVTVNKIDFTTLAGNYSTSEQSTRFTWIDGKTIYKKTVAFGALPDSTSKTIAHGVSGVALFIKWEAAMTNGDAGNLLQYPIPFVSNTTTTDNVQLSVSNTGVTIETKTSYWAGFNAFVTLYYTKL